ncbi:hypothetical protein chiPu_0034021, partial [Chiloscyllium punctatum]|nr:hypothetical protein [Chiloscyllium punctatum]
RGDAEPALPRLVDADRKSRPEPVDPDPPHDVAALERLEHDVFGDRDRGFEQAEMAFAPAPVLHAAEHRCGCRDEAPQPAQDADLEVRRVHRRPLLGSDQLHESGQRADRGIGRGEIGIGSAIAEPGEVEMDQPRIVAPDRIEIDVGTIGRSDAAPVEQNVAACDQL